MTKPNSSKIPTSLRALLNEIILIPHLPQPALSNEQYVAQRLDGLQNQLTALSTAVEAYSNTVQTQYALLAETVELNTKTVVAISRHAIGDPMRAGNSVAGPADRLQGLIGPLPGPITTKDELLNATEQELDALNQHFCGILGYPTDGAVIRKRAALACYLGVVLPE
ncbi:hypothetical protein QCA50_005393 [Cerrena zonata]|uniref:Uncharacterized protein n=1 Tax=Cerrena zonata TaxID=2478898 RepID=A0AAW0GEU9_9APHY